jgi:hypothetical protein
MPRNCKLVSLQPTFRTVSIKGETIMSKSQDAKKAVKKEPVKTLKEKKAAKKAKKEEKMRQGPG